MCGIAGLYNYRSDAPADRVVIERMTNILSHRGPDGKGYYMDHALGMGHRRLSILDLSDRGQQPMVTRDKRFAIAYNGEVYNYVELRHELEADGYEFRTDTDTEVVLALFARFGIECITRLNGMFAFAVWDSVEKALFLVRDRVGIKPLYYALVSEGVVFASEIKSLIASGMVAPQVAYVHLESYFRCGYVSGSSTLFHGVCKLLPGHWLRICANRLSITQYWDLNYLPNHKRTVEETAEELHELLADAMTIHMRSDVPVGVFLSGGLDSSTTVALLAERGHPHIKTFSVAYQDRPYDETPYAEAVALRFGTDHHVLYLEPSRFRDFIPQYVWYMDEPVTEAAGISLYFIAKLLREHVTVALSGEGADELLGGYDIYRYMRWLESYRRVPEWMRKLCLDPVLGGLGGERIRKYLNLARHPLERRYGGVSMYDPASRSGLFSSELRDISGEDIQFNSASEHYSKTVGHDALTRMLYSDIKSWLPDDLLIKADKMTMANSVELRVPFLDTRVIEFAATIPSSLKIRHGTGKWILKHAMKGRLPPEILSRKKMGFPTPLAAMFRNDPSGYMPGLLLSRRCLDRGYYQKQVLERVVTEHVRGERDHHRLLWQLIVLEEWHRQFIDAGVGQAIGPQIQGGS